MAADEMMLQVVDDAPATIIRFYGWSEPALSLGNSQTAEEAADIEYCRKHGIHIVRRPTGGQAVLHDQEVTYAVASSHPDFLRGPSPYAPYRRISAALAAGFEKLGIQVSLAPRIRHVGGVRRADPCFLEAGFSEIIYNGRKIAGSAQKRLRNRFLQHGSILIRFDPELLAGCTRSDAGVLAQSVTSITEIMQKEPLKLDRIFADAFCSNFGVELIEQAWSGEERLLIEHLIRTRYGTDEWNFGGLPGVPKNP